MKLTVLLSNVEDSNAVRKIMDEKLVTPVQKFVDQQDGVVYFLTEAENGSDLELAISSALVEAGLPDIGVNIHEGSIFDKMETKTSVNLMDLVVEANKAFTKEDNGDDVEWADSYHMYPKEKEEVKPEVKPEVKYRDHLGNEYTNDTRPEYQQNRIGELPEKNSGPQVKWDGGDPRINQLTGPAKKDPSLKEKIETAFSSLKKDPMYRQMNFMQIAEAINKQVPEATFGQIARFI